MKKEKRNKLLAVFLVMVMAILLLSGCGGKRAENRCSSGSRSSTGKFWQGEKRLPGISVSERAASAFPVRG